MARVLTVAMAPPLLQEPEDKVWIVVDVLRASSTLVTLLDQGCEKVLVARTVAQARRMAEEQNAVLIGEINGVPPRGFDYGNSPRELMGIPFWGREIVLKTSNGTVALHKVRNAQAVLIGCALNASACCRAALELGRQEGRGVGILCSGSSRGFALDDGACAGFLVTILLSMSEPEEFVPDDAAWAMRQLWQSYGSFEKPFADSASGRRVIEIGDGGDLSFCARIDASVTVPYLVRAEPDSIVRWHPAP